MAKYSRRSTGRHREGSDYNETQVESAGFRMADRGDMTLALVQKVFKMSLPLTRGG